MTQPGYKTDTTGQLASSVVVGFIDTSTPPKFVPASVANPLPVTGGGGGGGGGDASAANQATQITAEQAIQASVASIDSKTPASPATSGKQDTGNTSLASIDTKLGSPLAVTGTFWPGTQPVSGTFWQATQPVSIAAMTSTAASDANRLPVSVLDALTVGPVSLTATGVLFTQDLTGYASISVQVTSAGTTCTITYETSDDNTNWASTSGLFPGTTGSSSPSTTTTTTGVTVYPRTGRYFRARVSTYGSGTVTVLAVASQTPVTAFGAQHAVILAASSNVVGKVGIDQTTPGTTNLVAAVGSAAAGASISGAPVLHGGAARTANPTAVTDGQAANVMTDKMGRLVTVASHVRDLVSSQATTITSSTSATTIVAAAGANVFADITHISITNSSATATLFTLTGAAGTFIWSIPANGGLMQNFNPPLPASAANTVWQGTCGTSVASIYVAVAFVKNL